MTVRVALIDSGIDAGPVSSVVACRDFASGPSLGHGAALAGVIHALAPDTGLLDARVFGDRLATRPEIVAAAMVWAVGEGARIVNLSLGLRRDDPALREACAMAISAGSVVVASVPARGGPVYPGAYDGVVRVTGDARCAPGVYAWIGDAAATFGAAPDAAPQAPDVRGASIAAARVTGALAVFLATEPALDPASLLERLRANCRITGREHRRG